MTTIDKIVDFNTEKYLHCEARHINQLYNDRPHIYAQYDRTKFIADVYIPSGLAENFRQYWFGEKHLLRQTPENWRAKENQGQRYEQTCHFAPEVSHNHPAPHKIHEFP